MEAQNFANWLLDVGKRNVLSPLPMYCDMVLPTIDPQSLVTHAFPSMAKDDLMRGCIFAPGNRATESVNETCLTMMVGDEHECISADIFGADDQADAAIYPPELLHQLRPPGMPPHVLKLEIGAPLILPRNLNRAMGEVSSWYLR